jgi:hypothetical protein
MTSKNRFNLRGAVSLLTTWIFTVLLITGTVLFIVPQGRIAYWTEWQFIGLGKEGWGNIHILFGVLFIIIGVWHLIYNWKPFLKYLRRKVEETIRPSRELGVTLGLAIILTAVSVAELPPASWLFDLNSMIKASWVDSPESEPPFGHAEELSFEGFTKKMLIDSKQAKVALEKSGWRIPSGDMSLKELSRINESSSMALYSLIRYLEPPPDRLKFPVGELSKAEIEARFAGSGLGKRKVSEVANILGVPLYKALARLKTAEVDASAEEQLKPLADRTGNTPMALLMIIARGDVEVD